jgi:hypothetical protein
MARSSECTEQYAQKVLDTADIVRDAIYRHLTDGFLAGCQRRMLQEQH